MRRGAFMDYRVFDRVRKNVTPIELETIEAYAQGRMARRDFLRRGLMIGLSLPVMAAIISACGSDSNSGSGGTTGGTGGAGGSTAAGGTTAPGGTAAAANIKQGGTLRIVAQTPAGPLDPVAMADLGTYCPVTTCFEYLVDALAGDVRPMLAEKWAPNADGSVWTFNLRKGVKWHDGTPFTSADV